MNKERLEEANKKFLETIENTPKQQELSLAIQRGEYDINVDEVFDFTLKEEFTPEDIDVGILYCICILHNRRYQLGVTLHKAIRSKSKEVIPYEKYKLMTDNVFWSIPDYMREFIGETIHLSVFPESYGGKRQRV